VWVAFSSDVDFAQTSEDIPVCEHRHGPTLALTSYQNPVCLDLGRYNGSASTNIIRRRKAAVLSISSVAFNDISPAGKKAVQVRRPGRNRKTIFQHQVCATAA
jgi:hypothetical protein